MYIDELSLKNFRGFREVDLKFNRDLNVLIGENGTGKSSVLDALEILLSWFAAGVKGASSAGRQLADSDIKNDTTEVQLALQVISQDTSYHWKLAKKSKGKVTLLESSPNLLREPAKKPQMQTGTDQGLNLTMMVYYPVNRAVVDIPLRVKNRQNDDSPFPPYEDFTLTGSDFRRFFEWFREKEDLENEKRLDLDPAWRDPQLNVVRLAITELTGFQNLRIRRNPLRMELFKDDQLLTVNQLSDGEKCLLAMVGDLARRLALSNPLLINPLEGIGVVMIDEIELHLHPSWQRKLLPGLRRVFPNCQFIVTTHSPQVLSHVAAEKIVLLRQTDKEITVHGVEETYGKNSDRILEDIMGVPARPREVEEQIHTLYRLIDQNDLSEARELAGEIYEAIGEDPELLKANVLIRRKELIGK